MAESALTSLTPRQIEILSLVAKGLTNKDISAALNISRNTVRVHLTAILDGLGAANRTEATAVYQRSLALPEAAPQIKVAARIGRPAIAVLNFRLLGGTDEDGLAHLGEGLTEDLITRLASWRWFPVIAHNSSQRYMDRNPDIPEIGRELGVRYLITGTLRHDGERARLNVHLWETATHTGLWSDTFDFDLQATLDAQQRVAQQIVAQIAPELINFSAQMPMTAADGNFDAWNLTMTGMSELGHRTLAKVTEAHSLFQRAIDADPELPLPWYGLVWVHHHVLIEQWSPEFPSSLDLLDEAARRLRMLDPNSALSALALGVKEVLHGNAASAVKHLKEAARLNPSSFQALGLLGQIYCLRGQPEEAIALVEDALQLSPFNPNAWAQKSVIALAHYAADRPDEAIAMAESAIADKDDAITAHLAITAAAFASQKQALAQRTFDNLLEKRPNFRVDDYLRLVEPLANTDEIEKLRRTLASAPR